MPTGNSAALHALAEKTAATIQATVRRWWLDPANHHLLHIAAERTFVGARPIAVHFTVRLQPAQPVIAAGPARMHVGVSIEPPPAAGRGTPTQPVAQRPVSKKKRQTRVTTATKQGNTRKPRARASAPARAQQSKKRAQSSVSRKKNQTSLRRTSRHKTGRGS